MRAVLKLGTYRRLLVAYTLNELAWPIGTVALAVLVYRRTGSAVGAMAYFLCAQFLPALISPAVVGRVDRLAARTLLPILYGLEAVAFLLLGMLASHNFSLTAVLVLTVADGVAALTARAIVRAATVAVLSPVGMLREGNALANTCFSVCFMAGPAIGGAVVAAGGTGSALYINAGLFAAVAATIIATRGLPRAQPQGDTRGRLRAAVELARSQTTVHRLLAVQAIGLLFFTISTPVEIVLVQHSLHAGAGGYGALVSAWGAGSLAGSAVFARWRRRSLRTLIAVGAALLGAGFIVMAVGASVVVVVAGSALAGIGNGIEVVAARTALQEEVEQQWMALIMSLNESISQATPGLGIVLGGVLAALAGPRPALAIGAVGSLGVAGLAWVWLRSLRGPVAPQQQPVVKPEPVVASSPPVHVPER